MGRHATFSGCPSRYTYANSGLTECVSPRCASFCLWLAAVDTSKGCSNDCRHFDAKEDVLSGELRCSPSWCGQAPCVDSEGQWRRFGNPIKSLTRSVFGLGSCDIIVGGFSHMLLVLYAVFWM